MVESEPDEKLLIETAQRDPTPLRRSLGPCVTRTCLRAGARPPDPPAALSRRPGAAAAWRAQIVPRPVEDGDAQAAGVSGESAAGRRPAPARPPRPARPDWAALLRRVFRLRCPALSALRRPPADRGRPHAARDAGPAAGATRADRPGALAAPARSPPRPAAPGERWLMPELEEQSALFGRPRRLRRRRRQALQRLAQDRARRFAARQSRRGAGPKTLNVRTSACQTDARVS